MTIAQAIDTLRMVAVGDSASMFLPRHASLGNVAQWASAGAAVTGLCLAIFSAWWAAKQWRIQYFTAEWGKTVQFLFEHSKYLDEATTREYKGAYRGDELQKYQLVARFSIGYLDDLFHLRLGNYLNSWLHGSVELFLRPHCTWFADNSHLYSPKFVSEMNTRLRAKIQ